MSEKKQLKLSARAIANMGAIKKHIAADNPSAAESVFSAVDSLVDNPLIGHSGQRTNTRELVLTRYPYTVIYRVTVTRIIVAAVVHQRQKH